MLCGMVTKSHLLRSLTWPHLIAALAMLILALHPILWLVQTWTDPSYNSQGFWIALTCVALLLWSLRSPKKSIRPVNRRVAFGILTATALVRLTSELLAIHMLGAIALVLDVYAIGLLLALPLRKNPLSPGWLAILFSLSLPLERVLQRTIGYALQHASANGACAALHGLVENVICQGTRITIAAQNVLVDLPCSGARSTLLLLTLFIGLMALARPSLKASAAGLLLTLASAYLINALRITVLALGLGFSGAIGGIDVMAQPWHDIIGLLCIGLGCLPILWVARKIYRPLKITHPVVEEIRYGHSSALLRENRRYTPAVTPTYRHGFISIGLLIAAIAIIHVPAKPVDIGKRDLPIVMPTSIGGVVGKPIGLLVKEKAYFTQYGGSAVKMQFAENAVMVVRTSAPLRHLHTPDECLRGLGFKVEYKGLSYTGVPTAIYKATDNNGTAWRIAVTFRSDRGRYTTNVSEAVWYWMKEPSTSWEAVQRITPWTASTEQAQAWDRSVIAALDLSPQTHIASNQPR